MSKYWIGVVGAKHAAFGMNRGFCAFSHGQEKAVSRLSPGDRFTYYSPREGYREGDVVQAFVALGTVLEGVPFEVDFNGSPGWVRPARTDIFARVPVRPLLESLGFVSNPTHWGMAFRRSLFEISAPDFALIDAAFANSGASDG